MRPSWIDGLNRELASGYDNGEQGWQSTSSGSYRDPTTGLVYSQLPWAYGGVPGYGDERGVYAEMDGTGASFAPYNIMDAEGNDTGLKGVTSAPHDSYEWIKYLAAVVTIGFGGAAILGAGPLAGGAGVAVAGAEVAGPGMAGWGLDLGMAGTAGTVGLDGVAAVALGGTVAGPVVLSSGTVGTMATLSSLAGTVAKIAGAIGAVLGLVPGGGDQALTDGPTSRPPMQYRPPLIEGVSDSTLIWGAVALAGVMVLKKG